MKRFLEYWRKPSLPITPSPLPIKPSPLEENNDYLRCVALKRICMSKVVDIVMAFEAVDKTLETKPKLIEIFHKLSYINVHSKVFDFLNNIASLLTKIHKTAPNVTSLGTLPQLPDMDTLVQVYISELKDRLYPTEVKSPFYYTRLELESAIKHDPLAPIYIPKGKEKNDVINIKLVGKRYLGDLINEATKTSGAKSLAEPLAEDLFLLEAVRLEEEIASLPPPAEPIQLLQKLSCKERALDYESEIPSLIKSCIIELEKIELNNVEQNHFDPDITDFLQSLKSTQYKFTQEAYNFFKNLSEHLGGFDISDYNCKAASEATPDITKELNNEDIFGLYLKDYLYKNPQVCVSNIFDMKPIAAAIFHTIEQEIVTFKNLKERCQNEIRSSLEKIPDPNDYKPSCILSGYISKLTTLYNDLLKLTLKTITIGEAETLFEQISTDLSTFNSYIVSLPHIWADPEAEDHAVHLVFQTRHGLPELALSSYLSQLDGANLSGDGSAAAAAAAE